MELETIKIGFSNLFLQYFQNVSIYYGKNFNFPSVIIKNTGGGYLFANVSPVFSPISLQKTPEKINVN